MKSIKDIIRYFIYYIIGCLIFNIFVYITQLAFCMSLGIDISLVNPYIYFLKNNLMSYTIFYLCILMVYFIYNMILIKILNKKLKKVKKVGVKNEE